jgi:4,5-dihydroxyphthalate decarboxylase
MRPELMPVDLGRNVKVEITAAGKDMGMMLCDGEIDALISPQPRKSMWARPDRYRRLFPDVHAEEVRYFKKYGFFPFMHVVVLKRELADRFSELPLELLRTFEQAKKLAFTYYEESNYSLLVDGRTLYEQQSRDFGDDPWPNGFKANRKNLEQFIGYSHDQRLISAPFPVDKLFHPSTHDT